MDWRKYRLANSIWDSAFLLFVWFYLLAFLALLSFSSVFAGPLDGFEIIPAFTGIGACATTGYMIRLMIRWTTRRDDPRNQKPPPDTP